jgi:hypothetical protein
MKLVPLTRQCFNGDCPAVYATDHGTMVIQGKWLTPSPVELGEGEAAIEIPAEVFDQAVKHRA